MGNMGIYGSRKYYLLSGQTTSGTADTLNPIGTLDENDTIAVNAIPTFTDNVNISIGTGEAFTITATDVSAPIVMTNTVTTPGTVGCRALFAVITDAILGSYVNGLKGYMEFSGSSGRTTGLASGVCAELKMPNWAATSGHYYPLEVEWIGQTNSGPGVHHGFITCRASGTRTNFDASGFLLDIQGLSAGTSNMYSTTPSDKTNGAVNGTLKIQIGATTWYIPLWDQVDGT